MAALASEWNFSQSESWVLDEIPRRLASLGPELVMLFGSRATGTAHRDSDYDLLVVMNVDDPRQSRTVPVRRLLRGMGVPFDIVVYTPQQWAEFRRHPRSFAHDVARHGKVLHGAP